MGTRVNSLRFGKLLLPADRVHVPILGRGPEWDPYTYRDLSLAGNPQAALFYPPGWLISAFSFGQAHVSFMAVQAVIFLHVWAAFLLACAGIPNDRPVGIATKQFEEIKA